MNTVNPRHEVILGTREGVVHVLSIEVNPEEQEVEGRDGASAKDPRRAKQGTAASTPCPREDISSGMYSTSTPPIEELALEHGEKWVVRCRRNTESFSSNHGISWLNNIHTLRNREIFMYIHTCIHTYIYT